MLPSFLESSWKTYKEDTNTVADWLATKAKQCGYPADLLDRTDRPPQVEPSKRLRGSARKKAKDAAKAQGAPAKASEATATPPPKPNYIINVKEFTTLAEFIAVFNKPAVQIPRSLVSALNRAIDLRRKQREHSLDNGEKSAKASHNADEGHSYFLGVLERTREILKPRMSSDMIEDFICKPNAEPKSQAPSELGNKFENLDIQEPSQAFVDAPNVVPAPRAAAEPHYEAERLHNFEEQYIAAHCLFEDVKNIRRFLRTLWGSYLDGMDITAISVTTNTAIDFIRNLEQDYQRQFPEHSNFEKILRPFYCAQCLTRGGDPNKKVSGDPFNFAVYDLAEECLLSTYVILESVQDVISPGHLPLYKPGHFGKRDMSCDWFQKPPREKFQDDKLVMLEAFPDLMLMAMMTEKAPLVEDDLIRGFRVMSPGKDIPLWLVFAAQCFLDAQHVLKQETSRPHAQLLDAANAIQSSVKVNLEFHQSLRVDNWPRTNDHSFRETLRVIDEWVQRDFIAEKLKKIQHGMPIPDPEPFRLLKQYPLLCGLIIFTLKTRFQEIGIAFANAFGAVLYSGHLYNAARQEKFLSRSWKDMEMLIGLQSAEKMFVGDRPTGVENYLKRFLLTMGYSAAAFANNRRKNVSIASSRGARGLNRLCRVGTLFEGRYCKNMSTVAWTRESMTPIIESMLTSDEEDSEGDEQDKKKDKKKKARKVKQSSSGALLRKTKNHRSSNVPTLDFLELLANALHAEGLELSLDYLRLHRFCWMLLRRVNEVCKPKLLQIYGPGYLEKEYQLPFVVGYILMTATTTSRVADVLLPKKAEMAASSQLLKTAAECIGGMIDSGAGQIEMQLLGRLLGYEIDVSAMDEHDRADSQAKNESVD